MHDAPELPAVPRMVIGERGSLAFDRLDDAVVDLFTKVVPDIPIPALVELLDAAWAHDRRRTVQVVFQTGNVRCDDGGKGDPKNFLCGLLWLWEKDPQTFLLNVHAIPVHTCLKHVLEVLLYVMMAQWSSRSSLDVYSFAVNQQAAARQAKMQRGFAVESKKRDHRRRCYSDALRVAFAASLDTPLESLLSSAPEPQPRAQRTWRDAETAERFRAFAAADVDRKNREDRKRVAAAVRVGELHIGRLEEHMAGMGASALTHRLSRGKCLHKHAAARCDCAPAAVHTFYAVVRDLFVSGLMAEIVKLCDASQLAAQQGGEGGAARLTGLDGIFAKFAPTQNGRHDKATRLHRAIAQYLSLALDAHPRGPELKTFLRVDPGAPPPCMLQRVLGRLRAAACVPESFVHGRWGEVVYNRVPSCSMAWNNRLFRKHDGERFAAHLEAARTGGGGARIHTGSLLPPDVVKDAEDAYVRTKELNEELATLLAQPPCAETGAHANAAQRISELRDALRVEEQKTALCKLQWREIVAAARKANEGGTMVRVPMADVSASMGWPMDGAPMRASVALSLLLMDVNPPPWEGRVLTFHDEPSLLDFGPRPPDNEPRDIGRLAHDLKMHGSGGGTDLCAAMLLLLEVMRSHDSAVAEGLQYEIVVFSDMEFDMAVVLDDLDGSCNSDTGTHSCGEDSMGSPMENSMGNSTEDGGSAASAASSAAGDDAGEGFREPAWGDSGFHDSASAGGSDRSTVFDEDEEDGSNKSVARAEWFTALERTQKQFTDAGLQLVPIVFWNLAASVSQPVGAASFSGVIQLGGYSAALLRAFLEHDHEKFTTEAMLRDILQKPAYEMLDVV